MTDPISSRKTSSASLYVPLRPPFPTHWGYICYKHTCEPGPKKAGARSGWDLVDDDTRNAPCSVPGWSDCLIKFLCQNPLLAGFTVWKLHYLIVCGLLETPRKSQHPTARSICTHTHTFCTTETSTWNRNPNWYNVIHRAYNLLKIVCHVWEGWAGNVFL